MSRAGNAVVVVGGGVVGATSALALARDGLDVHLIEARKHQPWQAEAELDLRVFALAPSSARLLDDLGVWPAIRDARVSPYRGMQVRDAESGAVLDFDAAERGHDCLGWIVENRLLVDRLWQGLEDAGVHCHCPASVADVHRRDGKVDVELDDGSRLQAALLVAADGAASRLRERAGIRCRGRDYHQRGVVAHVRNERDHRQVAWQRFLPTGPLAMLPLSDGRCSIVWTLPEDEARRVLALDDEAFRRELGVASDFHFGPVREAGKRAAFPLKLQLARRYHGERMVLIGDAAHVVHPLAGQGVNLGLCDVAELRRVLAGASDIGAATRLARYDRRRRSADTLDALGFDALERNYACQFKPWATARGLGLRAVNRISPLKQALAAHAAG